MKPRGIEMLIDILAREAIKVLIAKQLELPARNHLREKTAKSANCKEPALGGRRRYKDQILSASNTRARQVYSNQIIEIQRPNRILLVAGA